MKRAVFRLPFPKTRQSSSHKPTRARLSRYYSTHLYFIASKLHASYARLALRRRRLLNFFHLHRRPSTLGACNCSQREGFCVVVFWCVEGYVVLAGCFGSCLVVGPAAVRRSTCWHAGANGWMLLGEEGRERAEVAHCASSCLRSAFRNGAPDVVPLFCRRSDNGCKKLARATKLQLDREKEQHTQERGGSSDSYTRSVLEAEI